MNKMMIIGLIAAIVGGAQIVNAKCDHCGTGKKDAGACAKGGSGCSKLLEGITLTDEQKATVAGIEKACDGSKEACEKAKTSIRAALTAEQQKTFDANAAKCDAPAKKKCCPSDKKGEA